MHVAVLTRDLLFFTAAEGIAGAMGHSATQVDEAPTVPGYDLVVIDLAAASGVELDSVSGLDPLRTVAFVPHAQSDRIAAARAAGIGRVYRRGALANELPEVLREFGA